MPLPLLSDAKLTRKPVPPGATPAICVDVVDMGMCPKTWNGKTTMVHKIRVAFVTSKINPDTERPFMVSAFFAYTFGEKASLRKFAEQWRGRPYTPEQLKKGVSVERFIGQPALLNIVHRPGPGGVIYDNIASIMPLPDGVKAPAFPEDYIRVKDREEQQQQNGKPQGNDPQRGDYERQARANEATREKAAVEEAERYRQALDSDDEDMEPDSDLAGDLMPPDNEDDDLPF